MATQQDNKPKGQAQEVHRQTPRQKMINLMYVVLMAMLALNVSSDVLGGFSRVEDGIKKTTEGSTQANNAIYQQFEEQLKTNPTKVREWYNRAQEVKGMSDSLFNMVGELKLLIAQEADGKSGTPDSINNKEDLEACAQVMLKQGSQRGKKLYDAIGSFRNRIVKMVTDEAQKRIIESNLSTDVPASARELNQNWQQYMFENMPVAAAVTLLTKLQSDVRYAEGEVLHSLVANIDMKDIRVNLLEAFVIPESRTVVQGGHFRAQIVMAAIDTTQRPTIYIGEKKLDSPNGMYDIVCNSTGDFTLKGFIETVDGAGQSVRRDFLQPYSVVPPGATVSADIMNVLYAGYDNPMSVSIPGVPASQVQANMTGGTLTPKGEGHFIAKPSKPDGETVITVSANVEGRVQEMGKFTFRVRRLPDPTAYIAYEKDGATDHFRGGRLSKQVMMTAPGIGAAIDDGLLNIPFRVTGFETVFYDNMGNAVPEVSAGANFTDRQKATMRSLGRGKRFYITNVKAIGPDGLERTLSGAMEVIVN